MPTKTKAPAKKTTPRKAKAPVVTAQQATYTKRMKPLVDQLFAISQEEKIPVFILADVSVPGEDLQSNASAYNAVDGAGGHSEVVGAIVRGLLHAGMISQK